MILFWDHLSKLQSGPAEFQRFWQFWQKLGSVDFADRQ